MKYLIIALGLALPTLSSAQDQEKHFAPDLEQTCYTQMKGLGCGEPTTANLDAFIACVDKKASSLSTACKELHSNARAAHQNHSH